MRRRRSPKTHEDRGAALIVAVGFMVAVGAIAGGLATLATNSVRHRNNLEVVRNREFAADGAIEQAITQVRAFTCLTEDSSVEDALNGVAIRVDWANACTPVQSSDGSDVQQRNVVFSAYCKNPADAKCGTSDVIIRAQVNFQVDPAKTYVQAWSVN
jgi:type II secretory pathway component PulK